MFRPKGPETSRSTFKYALETMKEQLRSKIDMFGEGASSHDTVFPVEHTTEFYRVWSAIQFIICYPVTNGPSPLELFGDGILWAGSAIIYLLGQLNRFQVLDFCAHTRNVEEATDMKYNNTTAVGQRIEHFFSTFQHVWAINEEVWRTCASVVEPLQYDSQIFVPPTEEIKKKFIEAGAQDHGGGAVVQTIGRAQGRNLSVGPGTASSASSSGFHFFNFPFFRF